MRSNNNPDADKFSTFSIIDKLNALNINHSKANKQVISFDLVAKALKLPEQFKIGSARDNGGCFFDCIAQSLNAIHNSNEYDEKSLRLACFEFYLKNTALVAKWNDIDAHHGKYLGDYSYVQFTEAELDMMAANIAPTWGRPGIEGRILCEVLNLKHILVVEVLKVDDVEYQPIYSVCTADGLHEVYDASDIKYDENTPILMNISGDLHFTPVLPVKMFKNLDMQKEESKTVLTNDAVKEKAVIENETPIPTPKKMVAKKVLTNDEFTEKSVAIKSVATKSIANKLVMENEIPEEIPAKMTWIEKVEGGDDRVHELEPQKAMQLVELLQTLNQEYIEAKSKEIQFARYHATFTTNNLFAKQSVAGASEAVRESAVMIAIEGLSSLGEMDKRAVFGHALVLMVFGDDQSQAQLLSMLDNKPANNFLKL